MAKRAKPDCFDKFIKFMTTMPGILTAIAAVITASTGLYIAFVTQKNNGSNAPTTPTPQVASTQKSSPAPSASTDSDCLENEFAAVNEIELGTGEQTLREKDGLIKIKLTDNHKPVGALSLKYYPKDTYFEIEKAIDAKCAAVEDIYNSSRSAPIDKNHKAHNNDSVDITFEGRKYSLRLMYNNDRFTTHLTKPLNNK